MATLAQFAWLAQHVPAFGVHGSRVKVLQKPQEFYQTLKKEALRAKKRIVLSSLYLGTGHLEQEFVDALYTAQKSNPDLELRVLLDYTRGSRGERNSRTMLLPLLRDFGERTEVALYHTPDLRGLWKRLAPERYNETVGVQHMKVYLFDDNLVMSGANLSESYFTDRQDRYMVFEDCPNVSNFFSSLINSIASVSFQLKSNNQVYLPEDLRVHPFLDSDGGRGFKEEAFKRVQAVIEPSQYNKNLSAFEKSDSSSPHPCTSSSPDGSTVPDTWVFPLVQMGPFGITVDGEVTTSLLTKLTSGTTAKLASGYFNLTNHYRETIINQSKADFDILTAAPQANGFYGGRGISGAIPSAYTYIARQFYNQLCVSYQQQRISLHEFHRKGWTFHAKGLWGYLPGNDLPSLSLMGSPNFGHRSVYRDLEAQVAVVTDNKDLQTQLHQEQASLYRSSTQVSEQTFEQPERQVPLWVSIVATFMRNFF